MFRVGDRRWQDPFDGAFISYLHLAHGINNFFALAPNLTIYNKLITDFMPNTPKYVFKGIAEFTVNVPAIITGNNDEQRDPASGTLFGGVVVNIFNISKYQFRGARRQVAPHQAPVRVYRRKLLRLLGGPAGLGAADGRVTPLSRQRRGRAINELKPLIGLEFRATPFVESARESVPFKNVVMDYLLERAMEDSFVKYPPKRKPGAALQGSLF